MDRDLEKLKAELRVVPRGRNTQPYPPELRERVVRYAQSRVAAGDPSSSIARGLGLRPETLRRWLGEPEPVRAVPVVVEAPAVAQRVVVVSPTGWRIEGLSTRDAWALVRLTA